jgi:hypothetical protein
MPPMSYTLSASQELHHAFSELYSAFYELPHAPSELYSASDVLNHASNVRTYELGSFVPILICSTETL